MEKSIPHVLDQEEDTQKNKFLTFKLGDESYGIEIKHVTEIIGIQPITGIQSFLNILREL
jgi:purine-binding chemotaxis protein CheW